MQIFITGGTFDKEYNLLNGHLFFRDSHIPDMLERGRCTLDVEVRTLMMIDSLEMGEEEREMIAYQCKKSDSDQIVITHGTDTMVATAKLLTEKNIVGKTIVLTGAMIPCAFGNSSDGFFNLGSSIAFAQTLPAGVYICMNGRAFPSDQVVKNKETGYFVTVK
jgi:L-asparaginase